MSEQAIVLNELTKHYGKHRGINNLSFSVNQGEFFGFIGPNGAGKSTTIRTVGADPSHRRQRIYLRFGLSLQGQRHRQGCGLSAQREQLLRKHESP